VLNELLKEKRYRVVLCLALALVGALFFASGSFMASLLQMDPVLCSVMSAQLVGVGFFTACILMARYLHGQNAKKCIVEAFCEAAFFAGVVCLFNLQYANGFLDVAALCAGLIFLRCMWWFFKQTDIQAY
jgi:hypothetical protein